MDEDAEETLWQLRRTVSSSSTGKQLPRYNKGMLQLIAQPDDLSSIFGFVDTQMTKKYSTAMC